MENRPHKYTPAFAYFTSPLTPNVFAIDYKNVTAKLHLIITHIRYVRFTSAKNHLITASNVMFGTQKLIIEYIFIQNDIN